MMARRKKQNIGWKKHIFIIMFFLLAIMFAPLAVLLVVGMIPTIVSWIVDRTEGRLQTVSVGAMNFAGCFPFLLEVFKTRSGMDATVNYIADPGTIVVMYFAAAMGYLINWAMTGIVSSLMVQKSKRRLISIEKEQDDLKERWGQEVSGSVPIDEHGFSKEDVQVHPEQS